MSRLEKQIAGLKATGKVLRGHCIVRIYAKGTDTCREFLVSSIEYARERVAHYADNWALFGGATISEFNGECWVKVSADPVDEIFGVFDECAHRQTPMGMIDEQVENIYRTYDRNALEVLGGAALAYRDMHEDGEGRDIMRIIPHLDRCMRMAVAIGWYAGAPEAMRTFCNLCMVDPALVEVLLGYRFEQVVAMYIERVGVR